MESNISFNEMKQLMEMAKTHICKIYSNNSKGTGFFCNIQFGLDKYKFLMTNHHLFNETHIQLGKNIKFSVDNDKITYNISIDNKRKIYSNSDYDVTFIEIKEDDRIDEKSFFDFDQGIFQENANLMFKDRQIIFLYYEKGEEMKFSNGIIKSIDDNGIISHTCDSTFGSTGGPLINKENFKVIGIHCGKGKIFKKGTFLKGPIEKFIQGNK